jgi:hypothetical protein
MAAAFIAKGWVRRKAGSRALDITPNGRLELERFMQPQTARPRKLTPPES